MLDEVDRLTVEGWGEGKCTKCLKGAWNEKNEVEKQKC